MLFNFTSNQGILRAEKENVIMPNIKPISDLRNYSDVLRDVSVGAPVFLTKNGRGRLSISPPIILIFAPAKLLLFVIYVL